MGVRKNFTLGDFTREEPALFAGQYHLCIAEEVRHAAKKRHHFEIRIEFYPNSHIQARPHK